MTEMDDFKVSSSGYEITLTDKKTKKKITVSLSESSEKWCVKGEGYQGYFKNLDNAFHEATRHLRFKVGGKETNE